MLRAGVTVNILDLHALIERQLDVVRIERRQVGVALVEAGNDRVPRAGGARDA